MSWHKTHRTTFIYRAVLLSLLGGVGINAHAINLGHVEVHSAQHEPLSATVTVSDIDVNNFNASVATKDIYEQMGLSPNAQISVNSTPTSDSSGTITLSSTSPITTPFTDVVLNLNNNGEQLIEPTTLLMPIPAGSPFTLPTSDDEPVIANEQQDLPIVTPLEPADPPMPTTANQEFTLPSATANDQLATTQNTPTQTPPVQSQPSSGKVVSQEEKVLAQIIPDGLSSQVDILKEEVTRRVYPAGQAPSEPPKELTAEQPSNAKEMVAQEESSNDDAQPTQQAVYVVQSGDSLWGIANQIAKANNISVNEVMTAIHGANPDAFNKGNINQLKTNASLTLPNYTVIPSQKAIAEAISAKRQHDEVAKKQPKKAVAQHTAKAPKPKDKPAHQSASQQNTKKALPKAQLTLVTPSHQGKATGTNNKPVANSVANGGDNVLVGALKSTRKQTADNAQKVNKLNQQLSTATQKLQLKNQKLAELEARLKALKENK